MTPQEISRSTLLDLVFDRRNKEYGAYNLRRYYDNRMALALSVMLGAVLLALIFRSAFSGSDEKEGAQTLPIIKELVLENAPPNPQDPPRPEVQHRRAATPVRTEAFTPPVISVDPQPNVPTQQQLSGAAIGTHTIDGPGTTGPGDPPPVPGTGGTTIEAAPPAPAVAEGPSRDPLFPGGKEGWLRFLQKSLAAPGDMQPGETRSVLVRFWVAEDGTATRFEFLESAGGAFDAEVLRVLRKMPRWQSALQKGRPVATSFVQRVTFQAPED